MKIRVVLVLIIVLLSYVHPAVQADVVLDWNRTALDAVRSTRTSPPAASRNLAILHTAIFDTVNGMKGKYEKRYRPYLVGRRGPAGGSREAAASAAAYYVLSSLWPGEVEKFYNAYEYILSSLGNDHSVHKGTAYGQYVAQRILFNRGDDGWDRNIPFTVSLKPGVWRPHESFGGVVLPALLPGWGHVTPFSMGSTGVFRPPPPPSLDSPQYAEEMNMIKALGGIDSALRTQEETEIAFFWANGAGTATPPGHWNKIARDIVTGGNTSLEENARLFALLNIALADAGIMAWDCKYAYDLWRPITAIREADADGNTSTVEDPGWEPLLFTPPFPEYISGHSAFSAAAATVLAYFFGTDSVGFTSRSEEYPHIVRSYTGLWAAAEESGYSRLYGGIHFMSGNLRGLEAGREVGMHVVGHECLPYSRTKKYKKDMIVLQQM